MILELLKIKEAILIYANNEFVFKSYQNNCRFCLTQLSVIIEFSLCCSGFDVLQYIQRELCKYGDVVQPCSGARGYGIPGRAAPAIHRMDPPGRRGGGGASTKWAFQEAMLQPSAIILCLLFTCSPKMLSFH